MNRKSFWIGFVLAVLIVIWLFQQRLRRSAPSTSPLSVFRSPQNETTKTEPDPLQEIAGIGPVYARRLESAGILTFRQLADLSADRIREIVKVQPWQADVNSWIEQARALAS